MKAYARFLGGLFGAMMILLALLITLETLIRKFFSLSMGGVDELGGYAIAIAAPLAFCVAMVEQAHIRINLLHMHLPSSVQAVLNALATLSMGLMAAFLLYFTVQTVLETQLYRSIAQTPWGTPLIYPQTVWLVAMSTFVLAAVVLSFKALLLLIKRDWSTLIGQFGPGSTQDELDAELSDLEKREGEN
ncbi:C4-dicarboxylate ABC transporter substrate-binding protein [Halomonas huangheensis]|uniref:TRAP transporter small permease protein n=2 Tax=Halomonas huangheensis TaxID=1178482 RepID=W1N7U5_9GAMM|nr:C4-dicarboxylate ABC transporter substrate-binding protein [Halomonas huangheensis]ERL51579.1 C4-dicarboxylate ABC transporter substrate-binding protein [Halomonas huangheensis]